MLNEECQLEHVVPYVLHVFTLVETALFSINMSSSAVSNSSMLLKLPSSKGVVAWKCHKTSLLIRGIFTFLFLDYVVALNHINALLQHTFNCEIKWLTFFQFNLFSFVFHFNLFVFKSRAKTRVVFSNYDPKLMLLWIWGIL